MRLRKFVRGARGLRKAEEGLAALEMALIFPVVVLFIFLTMDTGLFFYDYVSAANALREGARCGVVGYNDASVQDRVIETAGFSKPIQVTVNRTTGQVGADLIVDGQFTHDWILPATAFGAPTQFERKVTMRLETDNFTKVNCGG